MESPQEVKFKVVGTRPIRHDGIDKVTGRARYGADISLPGMLHGKVLRSPHAHARIKSIDASQALALPGVKAVITGADMPEVASGTQQFGEGTINPWHVSMSILARDKVLYNGHPVAAVAATSPHIAEEALALIKVDYEPLPHVLDVMAAMQDDAPILLPDVRTSGATEKSDKPTNVAGHMRFARGDLAAGFAAAEVIIEREFDTVMVHQGYIEPHVALCQYNADGQATVWSSTQGAFGVRDLTAQVLKMPPGNLKVVPAEIGGGFGGKLPEKIYLEPLVILLAKKTGKPVKIVMSRADVLRATGPTSGSHIRVKMGAKKDGTITAAQVWAAYEAGAFPGSPYITGAMAVLAPYAMEHTQIDFFDVLVNKPKTAAYRAPGATNAAYASETVIDELAEQLGIDPLEFRRMNGAHEGTPSPTGPAYKRIGFLETLEAAKNSPHYQSPLPRPNGKPRGRGVASGYWLNIGFQSSATVSINSDGTANVV
ncbi:MAG: xanthine dehydrogenase family protein molybdopterin-binding subunit, partial [Candidatus Binatia bacterium]